VGKKIQIVEDEIVIADSIYDTLEDLGYIALDPVINYSEALQQAKVEQPDLAILDIQLAGKKDGIDLARVYREEFDFPFIFLTSNAESGTLQRAKAVKPAAYLVKPFGKKDLYAAIEMALEEEPETSTKESTESDSFFVKDRSFYHKVKYDDLLFVKSDHVYLELHLKDNQKHLIRKSMSDFESGLPKQFYRVHRSYLVNLDHLNGVNTRYLIIAGHEIPIGQSYREELLRKFSIE